MIKKTLGNWTNRDKNNINKEESSKDKWRQNCKDTKWRAGTRDKAKNTQKNREIRSKR